MWPFRKSYEAGTIERLAAEIERLQESLTYRGQHAAKAQAAMHKMQRAATPEGLDAIAREVTAKVADIYASGHDFGGVKARDAAVYAVVHKAVSEATLGEGYWDTAGLAREAYREP